MDREKEPFGGGVTSVTGKKRLEKVSINPKSEVGGDEMAQDVEPKRLEEELCVSKDTQSSDERPLRPPACRDQRLPQQAKLHKPETEALRGITACTRSPLSTTEFGFNFTDRARSFQYAGRGIWLMLRSQHNAWIHAIATVAVIIAGSVLGISRVEWGMVVMACAAVWIAEALNTAIEALADATTKELHPMIGRAKDIAAGAVLIAAVAAVLIGALVFGPHFM